MPEMEKPRPLDTRRSTLLSRCLQTAGVVALAWVLSILIIAPFSLSTGSLLSNGDANDFTITDFYNIVANGRAVRTLDEDIVVVNIDRCGRNEIAAILYLLATRSPRAVGLDVIFPDPREDDYILADAIAATPRLIATNTLVVDSVNSRLDGDDALVLFKDNLVTYPELFEGTDTRIGAANLPQTVAKSTVRSFPIGFTTVKGDTVSSLAAEIAAVADPEAYRHLKARGADTEYICFPSHEFRILEPEELGESPELADGRIVLLGAMSQWNDLHATPISARMPGVLIHAYSLATILEGNYFTELPPIVVNAVAISLCALLVFLSLSIHVGIKGLVLRVLQLVLLLAIIRTGYWLFVSHHIIFDISYTLLMLTFSLFACDIWIGFRTLGKWGRDFRRRRRAKASAAQKPNLILDEN